jgi:ATP-binding cassette, subfamily B, bacterial
MYNHLQRLSLAYHDRRQKGDLVTRLTGDVNSVGTLFSENLGTMAQAVLTLVGMIVVSLLIDPLIGVAMIAVAPVLGFVTVHYRARCASRHDASASARARSRRSRPRRCRRCAS